MHPHALGAVIMINVLNCSYLTPSPISEQHDNSEHSHRLDNETEAHIL